jgi:hypothetical protein
LWREENASDYPIAIEHHEIVLVANAEITPCRRKSETGHSAKLAAAELRGDACTVRYVDLVARS